MKSRKKLNNRFRKSIIVLGALLATCMLFLFSRGNSFVATKLAGVDNYNASELFYRTEFGGQGKSYGDSVVIYSPFQGEVEDHRETVAEEIEFLCNFRPKSILFDYIFEDEYDFTKESDEHLIQAIKKCDSLGIIFCAPYTNEDSVRVNFFHQYINVTQGSVFIPSGRIGNYASIDGVMWMPAVVSGKKHTPIYYNRRGVDFSKPARIHQANHNPHFTEEKLYDLLYGKYVIFSDSRDRSDLHKMPFPTMDNREGNPSYLSGGGLLWYAMRSEIYDRWDYYLPDIVAFLFALLIGFCYLIIQDCLSLKIKKELLKKFIQFAVLMTFELFLIPFIGYIFMHFHLVLPLSEAAIILVFIDIFKNDAHNE